jgi:hypothetical protein
MYNYRPIYSAALVYFVAGVVDTVNEVAIKLFFVIMNQEVNNALQVIKKEGGQEGIDCPIDY